MHLCKQWVILEKKKEAYNKGYNYFFFFKQRAPVSGLQYLIVIFNAVTFLFRLIQASSKTLWIVSARVGGHAHQAVQGV